MGRGQATAVIDQFSVVLGNLRGARHQDGHSRMLLDEETGIMIDFPGASSPLGLSPDEGISFVLPRGREWKGQAGDKGRAKLASLCAIPEGAIAGGSALYLSRPGEMAGANREDVARVLEVVARLKEGEVTTEPMLESMVSWTDAVAQHILESE